MINGKKIVAFVPIKFYSQRLKNKNILQLGKLPLCHYIFMSLKKCPEIDEIYVFCSDDRILDYIPKSITFLRRSPELDKDEVKGLQLIGSFVDLVDSDIYILAHATAPFTRSDTISKGLKAVANDGFDSAFAVKRVQTYCWYKGKPLNYTLNDFVRTQNIEPVYYETSSFFIFNKDVYKNLHQRIGNKPYLCEVDDIEAIDIDEQQNYDLACKIIGDF